MVSHIQDVVHAARTLIKARAFTIVCVTSLGLGMGVVIAILLLVRMIFGTPPGVNDEGLVELVISGMVLLVVSLNISGMMLVRSAMRERELAIRLAIGASRWRLMQYHLSEALVMALLGGSLASALLFGGPAVVAWAYDLYGPELDVFKPDAWLVLQCIALCFVTSVMLGLLPALRFSRSAILGALKNDSPDSCRRVGRLQRLTAAAQAGIAIPFLVIGGVKLDQARVTAMAELGFKPQGLYAAPLNLSAIGKTEDDRRLFVRTVQENLSHAPGVVSVSVADGVPLDFNYRDTRVARDGESTFVAAHTTRVGAGYLAALGIRLLAGRTIDANDRAEAGTSRDVVRASGTTAFPERQSARRACRLCVGRGPAADLHGGRRDG